MNKYTQAFLLFLLNRRIAKMEKKAFNELSKQGARARRKNSIGDYISNNDEYAYLIGMRANIASINNPWQGVFAPYWTRSPKHKKYIQEMPESQWLRDKSQNEFHDGQNGIMTTEEFELWLASYDEAAKEWETNG